MATSQIHPVYLGYVTIGTASWFTPILPVDRAIRGFHLDTSNCLRLYVERDPSSSVDTEPVHFMVVQENITFDPALLLPQVKSWDFVGMVSNAQPGNLNQLVTSYFIYEENKWKT